MRVLIVSAHPDDETIGAGGTILRHADRGDELYWVVVTRAYNPPWTDEQIRRAYDQVTEVKDLLGVAEVFRLDFPTVKLNTVPNMELTSALQKVVDQVRPEVVYTTPRDDLNMDHRIVHDATLVATRPLPGAPVRRVLSYEISPTCRYGLPSGGRTFQPNVFVDISAQLDRKLRVIEAYRTEIQQFPHPRSVRGLEMIARERGLSVGLEAAECFELIRQIES